MLDSTNFESTKHLVIEILGPKKYTFLIWTNIARTNVAWTNVTQQMASVKDGPRNLPLKFGQNRVSNN